MSLRFVHLMLNYGLVFCAKWPTYVLSISAQWLLTGLSLFNKSSATWNPNSIRFLKSKHDMKS